LYETATRSKKIPGAMPPGGEERPEGKGRGREGWTPQL